MREFIIDSSDGNVEGILHLADQFQFGIIPALCSEYLLSSKCKKPAIFKYRLAAKYNLPATKVMQGATIWPDITDQKMRKKII